MSINLEQSAQKRMQKQTCKNRNKDITEYGQAEIKKSPEICAAGNRKTEYVYDIHSELECSPDFPDFPYE